MSPFNVLYYPDFNAKLLALLSERNNFDSVLFIFDGSRRYKFHKDDLGICSPSDLLIRNQGFLSLLNPTWSYYLYLLPERHTYSIDSLCGKVLRYHGQLPLTGECHVFIDRHKHHLTLLYDHCGEYISIHRQLRRGRFLLKKEEIPAGYRPSSWSEINRLLSSVKPPNPRAK